MEHGDPRECTTSDAISHTHTSTNTGGRSSVASLDTTVQGSCMAGVMPKLNTPIIGPISDQNPTQHEQSNKQDCHKRNYLEESGDLLLPPPKVTYLETIATRGAARLVLHHPL